MSPLDRFRAKAMFVSVQYQFGAGIGDHGAKGGRIVQTLPPVLVK